MAHHYQRENQWERSTTRDRLWRRMSCHGLLLGILLALATSFSSSYAQGNTIPCGDNEAGCRLSGDFSAVGVAYPELPGIESASSPAFGALVYTDFKALEAVAREHLERAVTARESFSPYQGNVGFDEFIKKLNSE